MREVASPLKPTGPNGLDRLSPMKRNPAAYLELAYDDISSTWKCSQGYQDFVSKAEDERVGSKQVIRTPCHEALRAALTPQNTIVLFRPYEHAVQFSRSCEAESLPVVPEAIFVSSVKAAVYANGFYVAPHHSALQLGIHVIAFSSVRVEAEGGHEAPTAKFRIFVTSAPARHTVIPLNAFVSGGLRQSPETSKSSCLNDYRTEPVLEFTSICPSDPKIKADDIGRSPLRSSFFGLVREDNKEITMIKPNGNCTVDGVISSTCEVLARCFGWNIEKRAIGHRELASFSEVIATTNDLLPVRSVAIKSEGRIYQYMKSNQDLGDGYKLLSRVFDDIVLGRTAYDFGWNIHSVYDTRFEILSQEKQIPVADEKTAAFACQNNDLKAEDFYFALLPARRFCN